MNNGALPGSTASLAKSEENQPEQVPSTRIEDEVCPECNGSLYISCFSVDGIKIVGCQACKGTGKRVSPYR